MPKHKSLECSGFNSPYLKLKNLKSIQASRLALARSMITLGPHHGPFNLGAYWWTLRGVVNIMSLLTYDLKPTYGFANETSSRQKADAFLLAEAFTHWFAQAHLDAMVVAPVEKNLTSVVRMGGTAHYPKTMPKYFRHPKKPGAKTEPDFLAFANGGVHVLESKGRSKLPHGTVEQKTLNSARNQALRQVCSIARFNGAVPLTRTACVFAFDTVGTRGIVTDPPEIEPLDLRGAPGRIVKSAYALAFDPLFIRNLEPIRPDFAGIEFAPGWRFGIHKGVLERLLQLGDDDDPERFIDGLVGFVSGESEETEDGSGTSIGPDGFILTGDRPFGHHEAWR